MRRAVAHFAVTGLAVVVLLGALGVARLRHTGEVDAINDARTMARIEGSGVVAPHLTPAVLAGDPAAIARLDRLLRASVLGGDTVRVKVWDASGRIVYSDEHRLIGRRFHLDDEELAAVRGGPVKAEVSNLGKPENRYERGERKLLEVYLGVRTPSGRRVLFESYSRFSAISASGRARWRALAPGLAIGLLALELAQVPLAVSLARRLRRRHDEREALLVTAVDSSLAERRRIAQDLHDGVVQTLTGVSYSLAVAEREAPPSLVPRLAEAGAHTRQGITELRTLLTDLYPPQLVQDGLEDALAALLAPLREQDIDVSLDVDLRERLPPTTEAVLYRAGQEGLRNVVSHADASRVAVRVSRTGASAELVVRDDGRGFEPDAAPDDHFGLRILGDLAREAGGALDVESAPGAGTTLRVQVSA